MEITIGMKCGEFTVVSFAGRTANHIKLWECRCSCGRVLNVQANNLKAGSQRCKSCNGRFVGKRTAKHGASHSPTYRIWSHMIERCRRKDAYRDVKVCKRWLESFSDFLADMGPRPTPKHSIDRIKNSLGYQPGNCRWATMTVQNRNKRNNALLTWKGETRCVAEWAELVKLPYHVIWCRVFVGGWTVDDALTTPKQFRQLRA